MIDIHKVPSPCYVMDEALLRLKYVPDKDRKAFAADLKTIYQAADEKKALADRKSVV